jgi:hypothetical protein
MGEMDGMMAESDATLETVCGMDLDGPDSNTSRIRFNPHFLLKAEKSIARVYIGEIEVDDGRAYSTDVFCIRCFEK